MASTDLTKFLWKEHKLVYLRPASAVDFELLDVLVKVKAQGVLRQRPLLQRIGSIFGMAMSGRPRLQLEEGKEENEEEEKGQGVEEEGESEGAEEEVTLEDLKQELQELRSCGSSGFHGKYMHTFYHGRRWRYKNGISANLEGSAMDVGGVGVGGTGGKEFIINNVESDSVDSIALAKCLSSAMNPWTPNIDFIRQWCAPSNKKELELWVVTKLFFHSGIQSGSTTELDLGVHIPELPVKLGARWKKIRETGVEGSATDVQPTSWIPFAYQAIRLRYSLEDAKLTNPSLHMGTARPVMRIAGGESIIIDPDNQPDFNMGELLDTEAWDSLEIKTAF